MSRFHVRRTSVHTHTRTRVHKDKYRHTYIYTKRTHIHKDKYIHKDECTQFCTCLNTSRHLREYKLTDLLVYRPFITCNTLMIHYSSMPRGHHVEVPTNRILTCKRAHTHTHTHTQICIYKHICNSYTRKYR